jgi:hypothetical protein
MADGEPHSIPVGQQAMAGAVAPINEEVRFFYIGQLSGEHDRFPAGVVRSQEFSGWLEVTSNPAAGMTQHVRAFK